MSLAPKQKHKCAALLAPALFLLTACGVKPPQINGPLPALIDHLACIPDSAAMMSAHRGTVRDWNYPENALGGIERLSKAGYLMAEIDVARLKDGTHILFHDGVWDETSTAKGPIAPMSRDDVENILLKSRRGKLSDQRPALLQDYLSAAKDTLYLEIDFKSSANEAVVIDAIIKAGMGDQVILISYNRKQRDRLRALAPNMLISSGVNYAAPDDLVWVGKDITRPARKANGKMLIGRVGRPERTEGIKLAKAQAKILVTDDANLYMPITGLTQDTKAQYADCLGQLSGAN